MEEEKKEARNIVTLVLDGKEWSYSATSIPRKGELVQIPTEKGFQTFKCLTPAHIVRPERHVGDSAFYGQTRVLIALERVADGIDYEKSS